MYRRQIWRSVIDGEIRRAKLTGQCDIIIIPDEHGWGREGQIQCNIVGSCQDA